MCLYDQNYYVVWSGSANTLTEAIIANCMYYIDHWNINIFLYKHYYVHPQKVTLGKKYKHSWTDNYDDTFAV